MDMNALMAPSGAITPTRDVSLLRQQSKRLEGL